MSKSQKRCLFFLILVIIIIGIGVFAPFIATHSPYESDLSNALKAPSYEHLFGTDKMGRDVFSRVIYGARTSISSTLILVCTIVLVGGTLGVISGYFGGIIDTFIMRIADIMVSFPGMALAIALAGVMGSGIINAILAIMAVSWTKYSRLARSLVLKIKHKDYILAAILYGTKKSRILLRYILPEVFPTLVITAFTDIGGMMLELAGFSFLGLGAQSNSIEWGYMLNEGRTYMQSAPWLMIFAGLAIFITVTAFNLLGDSIRDLMDNNTINTAVYDKKIQFKSVVKFVLVAICFVFIFGITTNNKNPVLDNDKHLNFGCYNYSDSLDPATNVNSSWCGTRYGITECLFKFDNEVIAQPNICDTYRVSDDYKVWTLHIRENVFFSNGKPVTASAVKASIERLYEKTDAQKGGTGNSNPEIYLKYKSIVADDKENTVTITCETPTANLTGILAYPYFSIIDAEVADSEIIGTGPYCVKNINTGISIDMIKNEYYWNGEAAYDSVTIIFIEDSATKSMALQSGDIDLAENITTISDLDKLATDNKYYISTSAGVRTGNSYINFNGILKNDTLRKAIIMSLDSKTMCDVTVGGMYTSGFSVLPSSLSYNYDKLINPYPYNTLKAEQMLDNAGIIDTNGDGIRELDGENININYIAYSSRNLNDFAEAIALQLNKIGIKVTVTVCDYDTATALQNAGEFDLITANTTTVGTGDPQDFLGGWYSKNSKSYGYYQNNEYDKLYEQLKITLDTKIRKEIITKMQQILIDDAATIVHGYYNSRMISNSEKVKNAEISTVDYYWLTKDIAPVLGENND